MRFDDQAERFDDRAGLPEAARRAMAAAVIEASAGVEGALLEIGAGTGEIGLELARARNDYVGLDRSAAMLAVFARKLGRGSTARLVHADAEERWPLDDGSTGTVFGSRSLHLVSIRHLVAEAERVAGPRGCLVLVGRVERDRESIRARLRERMRASLESRGIDCERGRGERRARKLLDALVARGARPIEPREVARFETFRSAAASLASWAEKDGLAGTDVPPDVKAEVLADVRAWAEKTFGDLSAALPCEEKYLLEGALLHRSPPP